MDSKTKDPTEVALEEAIEVLLKLEKLLQALDRENLRALVEAIPSTELDMRMARLRLQRVLDSRRPWADEKTPVDPILKRRESSNRIHTQKMPFPMPPKDPEKK